MSLDLLFVLGSVRFFTSRRVLWVREHPAVVSSREEEKVGAGKDALVLNASIAKFPILIQVCGQVYTDVNMKL